MTGISLLKAMTAEPAFDGCPARLVTLKNTAGMSVTLMDIGATWLSCVIPLQYENREVLLGCATMAGFKQMTCYMGATIGRYANRIASGQFAVDGQVYRLSQNQAGNTLHGGEEGFDKRRWEIADQGSDFVRFSLTSPNGDQGFPGRLEVSVTYQLTADNRMEIDYQACTDQVTPVNLTNHAYFNLLGPASGTDCKTHVVQINADAYLPVNQHGIPVSQPVPVHGTGFDFRHPKTIDKDFLTDEQQQLVKGYDHAFRLNAACRSGRWAAVVSSPDRSVTMKVYTDKPALQLYTGNWLAGEPDRCGGEYGDYAGFALETQFLPDSPHHPEWDQESCMLLPGEEYRYRTTYLFEF
ncbi:Aldose 1-epimerase [Vibrio aerogenes CECT 7868]|uniref:Aldose 1-epimerase n=1 Tax=Vibrio aerogenes CECT 7868 TaxID=1216006 RepID=A0A1M5ZLI7_9VIBR|nr:galactose-1-epimerase [Vibrio aerogenes]SHI25056.1 Aldose 1-epimerase [Vibrio aerogenes CECT 7868]